MSNIGNYSTKNFSTGRKTIQTLLDLCQQKHYVKALIELDITELRRSIKVYRREHQCGLSLTACLIKYISLVISENRGLNSYIKRNKAIVEFEDVDVTISIERTVDKEKIPLILIIRKANEKSAAEIHEEIRSAKKQEIEKGTYVLGHHKSDWILMVVLRFPRALRKTLLNILLANPFRFKEWGGTVGFTSLIARTKSEAWALNMGYHTMSFAVGGVTKKPKFVKNGYENRDYINLTVMFDHEIIDGAQAAKFVRNLTKKVEGDTNLSSIFEI